MTAKVVDVGQAYAGFTQHSTQSGFWVRVTATGIVLAFPCQIIGLYANSTSGGTIRMSDSASGAGSPVGGTITPALGMQWFPAIFLNGLFVTISGTLDVTFFYLK